MARTIVATFDSMADAERAASQLEASGIERGRIQVLDAASARDDESRWQGDREGGGFWSWLFGDVADESGTEFSAADSEYYRNRLDREGALVIVTTADGDAARVRALLDRSGAQDVDAQDAGRREIGARETKGHAETATERVIPVVEEQAKIGKREVHRGRVRVYTHVAERPIEEHIRLREERIRVERRPVDRPVTGVPAGAFKEQTIEITERAEEPVVQKEARVVEEVTIGKDVRERDVTVRDTVRRTEVEVDRGGAGFAGMEADFRQHCTRTFGGRGLTYEQCSPAYRYGYELAGDARYGGDWATIEAEARRGWETRHRGTWEQFKDAVRYAWDRARGAARAA
jgi:uncharacterized protein (TIGR02271 family)